ncbi:hypothetical protein B0H65DRAFT_441263 [Neurospora tetraspora]|uniref:Uncharacterized protein n=1 Tax=Neurospora tetraspora TaxID=94610 RepID=A0AAE0JGV7_9PEZI|nr:hypothetical protein B0H65DRAFT_441263 [Neurospora tetraspora]
MLLLVLISGNAAAGADIRQTAERAYGSPAASKSSNEQATQETATPDVRPSVEVRMSISMDTDLNLHKHTRPVGIGTSTGAGSCTRPGTCLCVDDHGEGYLTATGQTSFREGSVSTPASGHLNGLGTSHERRKGKEAMTDEACQRGGSEQARGSSNSNNKTTTIQTTTTFHTTTWLPAKPKQIVNASRKPKGKLADTATTVQLFNVFGSQGIPLDKIASTTARFEPSPTPTKIIQEALNHSYQQRPPQQCGGAGQLRGGETRVLELYGVNFSDVAEWDQCR